MDLLRFSREFAARTERRRVAPTRPLRPRQPVAPLADWRAMPTKLQEIADWLRNKRQDLIQAIETAKRDGLVTGATTVERIEKRLGLLYKRKKVTSVESAARGWPSLVGDGTKPGSRLSDLAFWMGCEDPPEGDRSQAIEDTVVAFLKKYGPRIQAYVATGPARGDEELALFVTGETFFNVSRTYWSSAGNARYLGEARAIGLLRTIAHRETVRELRKRTPNESIDDGAQIPARPAEEPVDEEYAARLAVGLAECFEELPPKCKVVAVRRYQLGESPKTIAEALGVTMGNVTNHTNRAVEHLTRCLSAKGLKAAL